MSRGVSFFRLPDEERFFLRLIAAAHETVVFTKWRSSSRKDIVSMPMEDYIPKAKPGRSIALARPRAKIHIQRELGGRRFTLFASRSQVLSYWSGRVLAGGRLEPNHVEFETSYVDNQMRWVHADSDFVKWGDKIRRLIRENTIVWKNRRMTERARGAFRKGDYAL